MIRQMYEQGLSLKQISDRTGEPYSRVRRQLMQMGVGLRSRAEGAALRTDAQKGKHYATKKRVYA